MFRAIREQIDTIFREDPAAKSVLEIVLCYPGFHAILLHRLAHRLYERRRAAGSPRALANLALSSPALKFTPAPASAGAFSSITAQAW